MKNPLKITMAINSLLLSAAAYSTPFETCPTDAFLMQDKISNLYGVQLATGFYEKISPNDWGQEKMNAIAFNTHDNYLYAYNYFFNNLVKIDSSLSVTSLGASNMPDKGFYVGDIAIDENSYYLYRPGSNYGLYKASLDPTSNDYLQLNKIVSGSQLSLAIYDLAFHPNNGFAYSVDKWGNLWKINVVAGSAEKLSNVGQSGTFGAVYFDVTGKLYISRNSDGHIYQIDTAWNYPVANFFAHGPSSSNNDGARCALAPIVSVEQPTTDFGEAPDSYGTGIDNNGARHEVGDLYFGESVASEPNAWASGGEDPADNDGINFVTGIEVGSTSLLEIESSGDGFVNAWADWDHNGEFEQGEKIITAEPVQAGSNVVVVDVPNHAEFGDTWSRFRLSSIEDIDANGGVPDGEVEDYRITVTSENVVTSYYPSQGGYATLAFEDSWPIEGDYDLNDLVIHYRLTRHESQGQLLKVRIEGKVMAIGASFHNGFAFHLKGLQRTDINELYTKSSINGVDQPSPLEAGRDQAIVIVANDIFDFVTSGENCKYYRTEAGCGSNAQLTFD